MPRVKAVPARHADDAAAADGASASTASAAAGGGSGATSGGPAITLRVRHQGGMSRLSVDAETNTVAALKQAVADLDSVLADPKRMLLFKEGALSEELQDGVTVAGAGLSHGSIVHMRLSKPRPPPAAGAGGAGGGAAAADGAGKRKGDSTGQPKQTKKRRATQLASGWSADKVAAGIVHSVGGGGGGSSAAGAHAQRTSDQFAQAHRLEAVAKGQLKMLSGGGAERGQASSSSSSSSASAPSTPSTTTHTVVRFTHRNRDAEVFSPLDEAALGDVVAAVLRKVRTKRRDNIDSARRHLAVDSLAGADPAVFWSLWLVAVRDKAADGDTAGGGSADGVAAGVAAPADDPVGAMQGLVDRLIDASLSQMRPSDMPLGLNV